MFEELTYEEILERMLERVPDGMDKREGSVIYDALAPAAAELIQMYIELDAILQVTFADTSTAEYLDRRCAERGITRTPATYATLKGVFTPTDKVLEIGTRFSCEDLDYEIIEKIEDGSYSMKCESVGSVGNTTFGQLIPVEYIGGLETAELTELLIPGEDEETDDSLRGRYMASFDSKAYGGNRDDYLKKTNGLPGVGSTKVTPVWNGGGTVKLTILNSNFDKASNTLIQAVQTAIDPTGDAKGAGIAPIGHIVTVDTASEVTVNLTASISFQAGYSFDSLKTKIENAVKDYLLSLREAWADEETLVVRISQIERAILSITGVLDITATKINGSQSNLTCTTYQVPVFGGVVND